MTRWIYETRINFVSLCKMFQGAHQLPLVWVCEDVASDLGLGGSFRPSSSTALPCVTLFHRQEVFFHNSCFYIHTFQVEELDPVVLRSRQLASKYPKIWLNLY